MKYLTNRQNWSDVVGSSSVGIHSHLVKITVSKNSQLENFTNCQFLPTAVFYQLGWKMYPALLHLIRDKSEKERFCK